MKKILFIVKILVVATFLTGCLSKDRAVDGTNQVQNDGRDGPSNIKIKTVFPETPVVTKGGAVKLTSIVTDSYENYLESTITNPIEVTWSSSDENVATVDQDGYIYGVETGNATILAVATKAGETSEEYNVTVNVVNNNAIDVAEIYLSLTGTFIDLTAERTFRLTAVDYEGTQTSLSEGTVSFSLSNENVSIDKNEIVLVNNNDAVEITLTGLSKGYTFVTPKYTIADGAEVITITGTPLIVQVKDPVESSKPDDETVDAGQYLSMTIQEDDGKKLVHVGHYDNKDKTFKYSYFDGTWYHDQYVIPLIYDGGVSSTIMLSPFSENRNRPMAVMLQDNRPVLWYQSWPSNNWLETEIRTKDIFDTNEPYIENKRLLDAVENFNASDSSLNLLHVAYHDKVNNVDQTDDSSLICMVTFIDPRTKSFDKCFSISNTSEITELSISMNRNSGEPRIVYVENNVADPTKNGIWYVTVQNGDFYKEKVTHTDGSEGNVVLNLDGNSVPTVFSYDAVDVNGTTRYQPQMFRRELVSNGGYQWGFKSISMDPLPKTISNIDFAFDSYNEPRVIIASDDKIRYARRVNTNGTYKWMVDSPGDSTDAVQGEFASIFVDTSNRAHIAYSETANNWFSYWAEPTFFNYRVFPTNSDTGADVIRINNGGF